MGGYSWRPKVASRIAACIPDELPHCNNMPTIFELEFDLLLSTCAGGSDKYDDDVECMFGGSISVPSFPTEYSSDWTMMILFESDIENVDFTTPNAAAVQQEGKILTIM